MKKLGLLRLFTCLPLTALVIPNITESFINPDYKIPLIHVIAAAALATIIGICSAIIFHLQIRQLKAQYQRNKN